MKNVSSPFFAAGLSGAVFCVHGPSARRVKYLREVCFRLLGWREGKEVRSRRSEYDFFKQWIKDLKLESLDVNGRKVLFLLLEDQIQKQMRQTACGDHSPEWLAAVLGRHFVWNAGRYRIAFPLT